MRRAIAYVDGFNLYHGVRELIGRKYGVLASFPLLAASFAVGPMGTGFLFGARGLGALVGPLLMRRVLRSLVDGDTTAAAGAADPGRPAHPPVRTAVASLRRPGGREPTWTCTRTTSSSAPVDRCSSTGATPPKGRRTWMSPSRH